MTAVDVIIGVCVLGFLILVLFTVVDTFATASMSLATDDVTGPGSSAYGGNTDVYLGSAV